MVKIDREKCTGCGECADICANEALDIIDGFSVWAHPDKCENCGICETICRQKAIIVEEEEKK